MLDDRWQITPGSEIAQKESGDNEQPSDDEK
jgi:hypothetical protein